MTCSNVQSCTLTVEEALLLWNSLSGIECFAPHHTYRVWFVLEQLRKTVAVAQQLHKTSAQMAKEGQKSEQAHAIDMHRLAREPLHLSYIPIASSELTREQIAAIKSCSRFYWLFPGLQDFATVEL